MKKQKAKHDMIQRAVNEFICQNPGCYGTEGLRSLKITRAAWDRAVGVLQVIGKVHYRKDSQKNGWFPGASDEFQQIQSEIKQKIKDIVMGNPGSSATVIARSIKMEPPAINILIQDIPDIEPIQHGKITRWYPKGECKQSDPGMQFRKTTTRVVKRSELEYVLNHPGCREIYKSLKQHQGQAAALQYVITVHDIPAVPAKRNGEGGRSRKRSARNS